MIATHCISTVRDLVPVIMAALWILFTTTIIFVPASTVQAQDTTQSEARKVVRQRRVVRRTDTTRRPVRRRILRDSDAEISEILLKGDDTLTQARKISKRIQAHQSQIFRLPRMRLLLRDDWMLPFKGEDFRDDERVFWGRAIHSSGGVQKYGYDLGIMRYDFRHKKWKQHTGTGENNSDWYIYGRPVYAMQDGTVIACWRNAPENLNRGTGNGSWHPELTKYEGSKSRIYGGGNGMWIKHADGSRVEYAHFQPGTVPASLCPHNDVLLPEIIASPAVNSAWPYIHVPPALQKIVQQGQFLGLVGNSGTSSNPHLHIHREEGGTDQTIKSGGSPVKIKFASGLWIPFNHKNGPYVAWKSFAGQPIPPGPSLIWPPRTTVGEHARHGYPAEHFVALFQHLADSGMWPVWMDCYTVGGKTFVNHIWRPAKKAWRAYFGLNTDEYQKIFDINKDQRFYPVFVDSYNSGGPTRYAVIFVHNMSGKYRARHGLTYSQHMAEMKAAAKEGLSAVNISVVSIGFSRRYTVLYRKQNFTGWVVKSRIPENQYQAEYNKQSNAGRKPIYLNAYMHHGRPYISAVFANIQTGGRKDRHKMSWAEYQKEYDSALANGLMTRVVTSFDGAQSQHRFAAVWW